MANQINIIIGAKNTASKEIDKIHKQFESLTTSKGFQNAVLGVGISAGMAAWNASISVIKGFGDVLGSAVSHAIEEEQVQARLRTTLFAAVPAWDQNIDAINKRIQSSVRLGYEDDVLAQSFQYLVGATHDVNKAFDVMAIAIDLARYRHISLQEASEALVKVQAGQYRMLKSLGIAIKAGTDPMIAMAAVQKLTAGQAEAYAQTQAGAADVVAANWDKLLDQIGGAVLPIFKTLTGVLANDVFPAIFDVADAINEFAGEVDKVIAGAIINLIKAFQWLDKTLQDLGAPLGWLLDTLQRVAPTTGEVNAGLNEGSAAFKRYRASVVDSVGGVKVAVDDTLRYALKLPAAVGGAYNETAERARVHLTEMTADALKAGAELAKGIADGLRQGRQNVQSALDTLRTDTANALSRAAEIGRLGGLLTGKELAAGLKSSNPVVLADAMALRNAIIAQLDTLTAGAYTAGANAAAALAKGLTKGIQSANREDYVAAAQKYKEIVKSFQAPAPTGTDFFDKIAQSAKAAGSAAMSAADKIKTAIAGAFDRASASAKAFFDSMHERNLRAIDDARRLAMEQFDAQVEAVDAEVKAFRDALNAKRTARREAQLREAVAVAESVESRASAEEELSDFLEDETLARMERDAEARTDAIEAERDAANARFDIAEENEDRIYEMRVAAWEKASAALATSLDKQKITYAAAVQQILALLSGSKGDYAAVGALLGSALGAGMVGSVSAAGAAVTAALQSIAESAMATAATLLTKLQSGAYGGMRPGGGRMSEEEAFKAYSDELIKTGKYFLDLTPSGGWRVTPTGLPSLSAQGLAGGGFAPEGWSGMVGEAGPERLTMLRGGGGYVTPNTGPGGSPVVIALQVDGRTLAEVVDRNLFYTYRTSARGA